MLFFVPLLLACVIHLCVALGKDLEREELDSVVGWASLWIGCPLLAYIYFFK